MKSKIWLSSPHIGDKEEHYVKDAFKGNWISTVGPNILGFETAIENYLGENNYAVGLSSGTAAIHLALRLLNIKCNDEVLCQSFTFCATANPIKYLGAKPIFIGSEPDTWNMCPQFLEEAIIDRLKKGKKPKAIIFVNLYGMPAKIDKILDISHRYEIPVIEDAAEALGSEFHEKKCGTFGHFSILSFNGNKIITTSGGGALISRSSEEKEKGIFYATQAKVPSLDYYEHKEVGYNYRLSNVCAGIGRGQMKVLLKRIKQRQANHYFYHELFKTSEHITLFSEPNDDFKSNHWLNCIFIDDKASFKINDIVRHLAENNIESRFLWKPMHLQPVFRNCSFYGTGFSDELFNKGICLPSSSNMSIDDRKRIVKALSKFVKIQ